MSYIKELIVSPAWAPQDRGAICKIIPSFPHKGLGKYYRTTDVCLNPLLFQEIIKQLADAVSEYHAECIASLDSRGHLYGATVAAHLGLPLLCIQKGGKIPGPTLRESYNMVYDQEKMLEIPANLGLAGMKVAVIDDAIATGGSMLAACKLMERAEFTVVCCLSPFNDTRHEKRRVPAFKQKYLPITRTWYDLTD
uniref:Adenine phosphoribosyltransferase n=1 Tax=Candidatus Kentrum sp. UNK TaxID=2126344 RepID=A0A451B0U3_9GAMM|nr:MAG: adenine phosphoribosyltransferase [Candidatus Kentron sp. UNK]VFK71896.1 MAG: adenine phosphoribosyltransferase [Candidatus Kentron sp. UNK]